MSDSPSCLSRVLLPRTGVFAALALLGACATGSRPPPVLEAVEAVQPAEDVRARLQAVLDAAAAYEKSPGMVMAVQMGNTEPMYFVTGYQDEAKTQKMTPEMNFRVGSITKNFVGTAILQQIDEGKVRLDDTLEKWLPGVIPNIDGNGITIRQMLSHTSGIESYTNAYIWSRTVYTDPTHVWNAPDELLKLTQDLRAQSIRCGVVIPPGSKFAYSNTNFILLGMIAAKADGHPVTDWQKVIEQRFFTRLNLRDSRIPANGDTGLGSTNHGYVDFYNFFLDPSTNTSACASLKIKPCTDKDVDFTQQDMSNAWAAGSIMSTAKDLLWWLNAEVKGDLLSASIRQQQQTFSDTCTSEAEAAPRRHFPSLIAHPQRTPSGDECAPLPTNCEPTVQVGLAMFRQTRYGFIGHRGEIFGFDGTIQYLPEKDLTVVVLSNRTALNGNNVGPVPENVAAALYPDLRDSARSTSTSSSSP